MAILNATVQSFDEKAGLGVVVTSDAEHLEFHATAIADGSRSIATGAKVTCRRVPAHGGRFEATDLMVLSS